MKLSDILTENLIQIPIQHFEKKAILEEMIDLAHASGKVRNRDQVLQAVVERENMMSTGIGNGVAIPHGKSAGMDDLLVALGITSQDVNFDSLDGKPVRIVFLLIGPETASSLHIKMLSRISRLLNQAVFRQKLIEAKSSSDAMRIIVQEEKLLES